MNDTFSKYGGQEADTKAVDFLQAQVGAMMFINVFSFLTFHSHLQLLLRLSSLPLVHFHFPLLSCLLTTRPSDRNTLYSVQV